MAKFKTSWVSKQKEDKKRQEEQQKLKDKHNIKDNNVVVVEKANMTKFTVKMLIRFVKLIATICLLILAAIGLTTLIFPETREAFTGIFHQVITDTETMITASQI